MNIEYKVLLDSDQAISNALKFENAVARNDASVGRLSNSVGRANQTLFAMNQIVRDAPFGFIAISNNIPILLDQFAMLDVKGRGFKAVLGELGAAFMGPAGLSVALSAGISLLTTWAMSSSGAEKSTADFTLETIVAKTETEKFAESVKKVNDELYKLSSDQLKNKIKQLQKAIKDLESELTTQFAWENTSLGKMLAALGVISGVNKKADEIKRANATLKSAEDIQSGSSSILKRLQGEIDILEAKRNEAKTTAEVLSYTKQIETLERKRKSLTSTGSGSGSDDFKKATLSISELETKTAEYYQNFTDEAAEANQKVLDAMPALISKLNDEWAKGEEERRKATEQINEVIRQQQIGLIENEFDQAIARKRAEAEKLIAQWRAKMLTGDITEGQYNSLVDVTNKGFGQDTAEINRKREEQKADDAKKQLKALHESEWFADTFATSFGSALSRSGRDAFKDIFGEANSLLEMFLENLAEGLLSQAASNVAESIFGSIVGGGGLFGGIIDGIGSLFGSSKSSSPISAGSDGQTAYKNSQTIIVQVGDQTMMKTITNNLPTAANKVKRLRLNTYA